mgnify:CR=1 FL=1
MSGLTLRSPRTRRTETERLTVGGKGIDSKANWRGYGPQPNWPWQPFCLKNVVYDFLNGLVYVEGIENVYTAGLKFSDSDETSRFLRHRSPRYNPISTIGSIHLSLNSQPANIA